MFRTGIINISILAILSLPVIAGAAGLVPCSGYDDCNFDQLITLISNFLNYLIYMVAAPIAAVMFAYAGYLYLTAGDSAEQVKKAHGVFIAVLWGFGIMLIAWALVYFILKLFTGGDASYNLLSAPSA